MTVFWNSDSSAPFWGTSSSPFWQTYSAAYSYDSLGRLTGITYANGTTVTYNYDDAGNRTSVVVTCPGGGC